MRIVIGIIILFFFEQASAQSKEPPDVPNGYERVGDAEIKYFFYSPNYKIPISIKNYNNDTLAEVSFQLSNGHLDWLKQQNLHETYTSELNSGQAYFLGTAFVSFVDYPRDEESPTLIYVKHFKRIHQKVKSFDLEQKVLILESGQRILIN